MSIQDYDGALSSGGKEKIQLQDRINKEDCQEEREITWRGNRGKHSCRRLPGVFNACRTIISHGSAIS